MDFYEFGKLLADEKISGKNCGFEVGDIVKPKMIKDNLREIELHSQKEFIILQIIIDNDYFCKLVGCKESYYQDRFELVRKAFVPKIKKGDKFVMKEYFGNRRFTVYIADSDSYMLDDNEVVSVTGYGSFHINNVVKVEVKHA